MRTLTPAQRRAFRAKAHSLHPVVAIGQHGLTPAVLHEIDVNLLAHELIKIRVFGDDRDEREALLVRICGDLDAASVQHLGKVLTIWRPTPPPEPEPVARKTEKRDRKSARKAEERAAGQKPKGPRETTVIAGAKRASRSPAAPRATVTSGAKHAPRRGRSVILGAEPARRAPRSAIPKAKAPSRRPPPPHGKSASSRVGASGARRRRKAR